MSSELLKVFDVKINPLFQMQEDLIQRYFDMDDPERMELSTQILDIVNQLLEWQETYFCQNKVLQSAIPVELGQLHAEQKQIEAELQKVIMVHVDEPDGTFLEGMKNLHTLFGTHSETMKNKVIPAIEETLSPVDKQKLQLELSKGMLIQK